MLAVLLVVLVDLFETRTTVKLVVTVLASDFRVLVANCTPRQLFDVRFIGRLRNSLDQLPVVVV